MITEATGIPKVLEAAKSAPSLPPGLSASEYPSGELWECSDQAEMLFAQRKRFLAEIGFCLVSAEVIDAVATLLAGKKVLEAGSGSGWLAATPNGAQRNVKAGPCLRLQKRRVCSGPLDNDGPLSRLTARAVA